MTKEKATSPEKKAALEAITQEFKGTDCETQRTRLMEAMQRLGNVTTDEARRYLDIYFPPARIKELRDMGEQIKTLGQCHHRSRRTPSHRHVPAGKRGAA